MPKGLRNKKVPGDSWVGGMMRALGNFGLLVLVVLIFAATALAQTGSIAGTVADASGALVRGAEITVRNTATNGAPDRE